MGLVQATIRLSNPRGASLAPMAVTALVETGAITLRIPEHVALQRRLQEVEKREVTTADERRLVVANVGPVQIQFENRTCFTGVLVLGDSVLMGAAPMEDMDLEVQPGKQTVSVNPQSPNIPSAVVTRAVQPEGHNLNKWGSRRTFSVKPTISHPVD